MRAKWDARQSLSSERLRDQWSNYQRGWWAYYGRAEEQRNMVQMSGWIRRQMRKCFLATLAQCQRTPCRPRPAEDTTIAEPGAWGDIL